jgi:hypothetical protein
MRLASLLDRYLGEREASIKYQKLLASTVRRLEDSGLKNVFQLTPESVNSFLHRLTVGQTTRSNVRRMTVGLWRYAFEEGIVQEPPRRIRRIPPAKPIVRAWSREDVENLLRLSEKDETRISRRWPFQRRHFLPAWIAIAWDSGLRFTDVHELTRRDVRGGCVAVTAHKTGKVTIRRLSMRALQAISSLPPSPDKAKTLFKWVMPRRRTFIHWRAFLDAHGIEGSSKYLRRGGATNVEARQRGASTAFLGHTDPRLAPRFYLDQTLLDVPPGPDPLR